MVSLPRFSQKPNRETPESQTSSRKENSRIQLDKQINHNFIENNEAESRAFILNQDREIKKKKTGILVAYKDTETTEDIKRGNTWGFLTGPWLFLDV